MKNKPKIIVALDIDGVVLDFIPHWESFCKDFLQRDVSVKKFTYTLDKRYGLTEKEFKSVWNNFHAQGFMENIPERANAIKHINHMHKAGISVSLVSAAHHSLLDKRRDNLAIHGLNADIPVFCTGGEKYHKLNALKPHIFVDDHEFHLNEARRAGVPHRIQMAISPYSDKSIHATRIADDLKPVSSLAMRLHESLGVSL